MDRMANQLQVIGHATTVGEVTHASRRGDWEVLEDLRGGAVLRGTELCMIC